MKKVEKVLEITKSLIYSYLEPACNHKIRCLPAFYVIGVAKSGTSNLHSLMTKHPHIDAGHCKEIFWMERECGKGNKHSLKVL